MVETEGYVYFAIKTEDESIEEETISGFLNLNATGFRKMYSSGKVPVCTIWEVSTGRTVNPDISSLISEVLNIVMPYKNKLLDLKNRHCDICYVLEIVISHGDNAAGFAIENDQLCFLSEIGANIDVDQYNYKD
jgi:hypothetical protein